MKPRCISLFTGAGGLDIGLSQAGFDIIFATDLEQWCKDSYTRDGNFGPSAVFHVGSITDVDRELIENLSGSSLNDLDLLCGGPPCPPYSKSRFYRTDKPRALEDPVGDVTLKGYLKILRQVQPKVFLFENVAGFAYKVHPEGFQLLSNVAKELGYELSYEVINAADYGVPQIRERFIMVGSKVGKFQFPPKTHSEVPDQSVSRLSPWRTAGEVLCDLPSASISDIPGHLAGGKHNHLLKDVPPGDNYLFFTAKRGHPKPEFEWRSRYWSFLLKLSPEKPSWTIQARRSNNMGPFHWNNRILTIEEVARLQTFPDGYSVSGTLEQQWRQIGNAVPPQLARAIGISIGSLLGRNGTVRGQTIETAS